MPDILMELRPLLLPMGRQERLADLPCISIAMKVPKRRSDRCAVSSDDPDLACRKEYLHVSGKMNAVLLSSKVRHVPLQSVWFVGLKQTRAFQTKSDFLCICMNTVGALPQVTAS